MRIKQETDTKKKLPKINRDPTNCVLGEFQHVVHFPLPGTGDIIHEGITYKFSVDPKFHDHIYENPGFKRTDDPNFKETVVYCIHGTADRVNAFRRVIEMLLPQLPSNVSRIYAVCFKERLKGKDIPEFTKQFAGRINKQCAEIKDTEGYINIRILAQSRGCLVAADFNENHARVNGVRVSEIHALGGPFKGTKKAKAPLTFFSKSVKQMQAGSSFTNNLDEQISNSEEDTIYYPSASDMDLIVDMHHAYPTKWAHHLRVFRGGHLSLLESQDVVDLIAHRMNHGPDAPLTMQTICEEITEYMEDFKEIKHWFSSEPKINILKKLQKYFEQTASGEKDDRYTEATTIKNFIENYMRDKKHRTAKIINSSLNLPQIAHTSTRVFIETLLIRYQHIPVLRGKKNHKERNEYGSFESTEINMDSNYNF